MKLRSILETINGPTSVLKATFHTSVKVQIIADLLHVTVSLAF